MRLACLLTLALLPSFNLLGEEEKVDFSEGLSRIAALGIPEMKGAEWVKLPDPNERRFVSSYELREMDFKLTGNTWKLKTEPATYMDFGTNQLIDAPADGEKGESGDGPSLLEKMLSNHKKQNPEEKAPPKPEANEDKRSLAAKDAAKIAESLSNPSVVEELNSSIQYNYNNIHGRLMLFAVQLHAAGETESANQLAAALFLAVADDSALIDGAISHLADIEYNNVANTFFKNQDWGAYQKSLTALLAKFPRGWANGPAVAMLASNLEKRSATPPKPSITGIEIKPEALALLDQLGVNNNQSMSDEELAKSFGIDNFSEYPPEIRAQIISNIRSSNSGFRSRNTELWILKNPDSPAPDKNASAIQKLQAMGMDGLIALAAIANDQTLVAIPHSSDGSRSYFSSNESPLESLQKRYNSLNRPTSRGEIASSILAAVIPTPASDPYSRPEQPDPSELASRAIEFWKTNKDKSPIEIAAAYIADGNEYQRPAASEFLASSKDPAAHAAFEKTVLSSDDPLALIGQVDQYITARKTAAKTFANAYIKLIKDNPPDEQELMRTNVGWQIREAGGLEPYLKRLSLKVGDVSLDKMIADALKPKAASTNQPDEVGDEFQTNSGRQPSPIEALAPAIQSISLDECLIALGKAAKKATPEQSLEIHNLMLGRLNNESDPQAIDPETGRVKSKPLSKEAIEIWKSQISREDPLPKNSSDNYFSSYSAKTLGDASVLLLEFCSTPASFDHLYLIAQIEESPNAIMQFARKRMTALVSGQDPEPWPSSDNVSEQRLKEISDKIPTLKPEEFVPFSKSLNRDERLALINIIQAYDEDETTPANLLELRNTVTSTTPIYDQEHDQAAAAKLGIKVGDKITPEFLTKLADDLLKDPAANSTTTVIFGHSPMYLGMTLYVITAKDLDRSKLNSTNLLYQAYAYGEAGEAEAVSFISVDSSSDMRFMKDGKMTTLNSEGSALKDLTKALEGKSPMLPYISVSILTRADAQKITEL